MKALIQRVRSASVAVDGVCIGQIDAGLLIFIGLAKGDDLAIGKKLLDKIVAYRVFNDHAGKMSLNVAQVNGSILLVSQFTLMAETRKGLRPDFAAAMPPSEARELFAQLVNYAQTLPVPLQTGQFAADMQVSLVNDGPVTFVLDA